jgi:hypothetical protein
MNLGIPRGPIALACLVLPFSLVAMGQQSPAPPKQGAHTTGGMSTAGVYGAVKDKQGRPITAGAFVENGPVVFRDDTVKSGLASFHHRMGTPEKKFILDTIGSGVALLDYDNDGWLDIYFVNGSTYDALAGREKPPRAALFHNNHDGTFTDVTEKAGVGNERWGFGVAVGDYDNDGWPDLYVTNYGKNRLYHNNGNGTFTDVAEQAGVTLGGWSTGTTWGDYDGDGRLDLFVTGYVKFDVSHPPVPGQGELGQSFCQYRGENVMCGPRGLPGETAHLFHNNGDGTFTETTDKAGVANKNGYYGLAAAFADFSGEGRLDLIVANDSTPNYFYKNRGDSTFENDSFYSGFAVDESGREQASMGLAIGDYDNDGRLDVYVTNFSDDFNTLYHNNGDGTFSDLTSNAALKTPTIPFLGWGTQFLDFDNDGLKDIFVGNGHVYPSVDNFDWGTTYAQRPLLFRNVNGRRFEEVPPVTGTGLALVLKARGIAVGDLFNDGRVDVVINNMDSQPTLLRHVVDKCRHRIALHRATQSGGRCTSRLTAYASALT